MFTRLLPPFSSLFYFISLLLFVYNVLPSSSYENGSLYKSCTKLFSCGKLTGVDYPFWGDDRGYDCGHPNFKLNCKDDDTVMEINNVMYRVLDINNNTEILRISRNDFSDGICTSHFISTTMDPNHFDYPLGYTNLTILYGCPSFSTIGYNFSSCEIDKVSYEDVHVLPGSYGPGTCHASVTLPVYGLDKLELMNYSDLDKVIRDEGFEVKWKVGNKECSECRRSGGKCGYNPHLNETTCFCADQIYGSATCTTHTSGKRKRVPFTIGFAVGGAIIVCIGLLFLVFCVRKRKKRHVSQSSSKGLSTSPSSRALPTPIINFSRTTGSYPSSQSIDLEKGSFYFGVQIFTYGELEEATNNFDSSRELGDGGFGVVYLGKLNDGRVVAAKRLYENNFKRVEQFINEVQMLARLRHPNLVTLYGCTSRRSQALVLVYEYISNGTVADHLHGAKAGSGLLTWPVRLSIAIETANALAYLHQSEIIHRDVKTTNILLDDNFRVKVADFGLSRLFPTDVTHVSTAPQGTPGYVDPEYYQCYQLTGKSDVYSFGVVLLELISSLKAVDISRHRHDINLSNMGIAKIQNQALHELVDPCLGFQTDDGIKQIITMVAELAFQCLQQDTDLRPSMEQVLGTLAMIETGEIKKTVNAEATDIQFNDVALLKNMVPPPFSPNSVASVKWVSSSSTRDCCLLMETMSFWLVLLDVSVTFQNLPMIDMWKDYDRSVLACHLLIKRSADDSDLRMPNMRKFKLLALSTRCTVSDTSTHSPSRSPVVNTRHHKIKTPSGPSSINNIRHEYDSSNAVEQEGDTNNKPEVTVRRYKLKELLSSSPPPPPPPLCDETKNNNKALKNESTERAMLLQAASWGEGNGGLGWRRGRTRSSRPLSAAIRSRLRKAWRPALVTIPE